MKLATIRRPDGTTRAVRVEGDSYVDLGHADLGDVLRQDNWEAAAAADGETISAEGTSYATLVANPTKTVCVGLNYTNHIKEMGRDLPEYPTLFQKFPDCLIGATDDVLRPVETEKFDWECELVVVIGKRVRRANDAEAEAAIAGFTAMNDITCRDWQFRTREWLQGKNWEKSTPVGPVMVTPDEVGGTRPSLAISTTVDGETMQSDNTGDLLFDPVHLVKYVSTMVTLNPGDLIATGTPGGVGNARDPQVFLTNGQKVVVEVEKIGRLENTIVEDGAQ